MGENRIVVMGGSFNPPTIAHIKIMQTALGSVNADRGFLVPVSYPYLKRKMVKAGQSHLCLSDDLRIQMLERMASSDSRIRIFTDAMGDPFSDDVGVMNLIRDKNPDCIIYYVAGTDKLDLLDHFACKGGFFDRFRCILFARDCECLSEEIASHEHLASYQSAFVQVQPPDGIEGISSTKIREHFFEPDQVAEMLDPNIIPILKGLRKEDYPKEILQFRDEYAFLSNDYPAEVTHEGMAYPCVTSAFLASGFDEPAEKKRISAMRIDKVKQKYSEKLRSAEEGELKAESMEAIVREKFKQHPDLMEKLISTGNDKLINGSKKDEFWGMNLITWKGENRLGKILMKIRSEESQK